MEQDIIVTAKEKFNEELGILSKQDLSALYSNTNPLIVLYAKLIAVEKKLDELNKK
jgi:hypothetical protein